MAKYDIIYPKEGQLTLLCNDVILANSKKKSYLKNIIIVNQNEICDSGIKQIMEYKIIDMFKNNEVVFQKNYKVGERDEKEGSHRESQAINLKFVEIEPILPIKWETSYGINNSKGECITDLELLKLLYIVRMKLDNKISNIISNKTLTHMATSYPITKDEMLKIYGVGEKTYENFGEIFIKIISMYLNKKENK